MPKIAKIELEQLAQRYLVKAGCLEKVAKLVAQSMVQAEFEGNTVCGLFYLPVFKEQLSLGKVDGKARPKILKNHGGSILIDAANGFAHPAINLATEVVIKAAQENGIAAAGITRSYNALSLAHHVLPLAAGGMIGICCSNAPASVAPPGGKKPTFGTNPMAFAVPGPSSPALVVDQSASAVTKTKLLMHNAEHKEIPLGWAQDDDGQATSDPAAGLAGSLLPFGGQKGANIGLIVEILSAVLTGANLSAHAASFSGHDIGRPGVGQFLIAIDPARFAGESFLETLEKLRQQYEDSDLRFPGKKFRIHRDDANEPMITVDEALWKYLSVETGCD